jgi:chorismate synthase
MNTFGEYFRITTFGESHGEGVGVVIDGCPALLPIDLDFIAQEMKRRRPGQSHLVTPRKETDEVRVLSGVFEGKTTGMPLTLFIPNENTKSQDYDHLAQSFRPSHADFTYQQKYAHRDHRGGGRSSARETAARVAAGAIAKLFLKAHQIEIRAYVSQVGNIRLEKPYQKLDFSQPENIVRCPDPETANAMIALIEEVRAQGDTIGGTVSCVVRNMPIGLGDPVYSKLHALLGFAMLSINAAKGFDYGSGFEHLHQKGSEQNDIFEQKEGQIRTRTNHSGGIQGGISNGEDLYFRVAFKPVATLMQTQASVDAHGNPIRLEGKGRHDPCVLPRAVPIVEAMTALVLADRLLANRLARI